MLVILALILASNAVFTVLALGKACSLVIRRLYNKLKSLKHRSKVTKKLK